MAAKTSTTTPLDAQELLGKLLKRHRWLAAALEAQALDPLEVKAALEEAIQAPPSRSLRQLVLDGRSLSFVARELGVANSTLREQLGREDMQLSTLGRLLEVGGYDLEVTAARDGKRFTVAF